MKFFTTFSTAITLISSVTAAPTTSSNLEVRAKECPSVQTIENWVKTHSNVGAKTVFYTGSATKQNAKDYAAIIGGEYWGSVYPQNQVLDWTEECGEQNKLVTRMAQALAQATTGQAYLLLPKGERRSPGILWTQTEWPALKGRVPVTAVNPLDFRQTLANWTLNSPWKRDFGFDETSA